MWRFIPDCFSGSTKLKVEPLPGSLWARIDPLCFSMIFFADREAYTCSFILMIAIESFKNHKNFI